MPIIIMIISAAERQGKTASQKHRSGGEPLATLCRFDRPGNQTQDLLHRCQCLNNRANRPVESDINEQISSNCCAMSL